MLDKCSHCRHKHQSWKQGTLNALQVLTDAISRSCHQIPDLRQTGHFASARCRHKHQSWSCEKLDALQVLTVAPIINHGTANKQGALQVLTDDTNINHGAAKSWMLYKCWLSHQASIRELRNIGWFTSADCRNKQLDDLQVPGVGVRVRVGVGQTGCYHCSL